MPRVKVPTPKMYASCPMERSVKLHGAIGDRKADDAGEPGLAPKEGSGW
jgi:hypothetical protein